MRQNGAYRRAGVYSRRFVGALTLVGTPLLRGPYKNVLENYNIAIHNYVTILYNQFTTKKEGCLCSGTYPER